ncbi:MAG: paraquat-inducible protein A [Nitrospira sp.]|nr:paraquat-inducible protein A [Nitrospira sp.]
MNQRPMTARQLGLCACHTCGLLSKWERGHVDLTCPRCRSHLHLRKPDSIARTWAFLIASYLLFLPANLLPIMHTNSLFGAQSDTIMSGIVYLWVSGSWHLALVVFIASILVPSAKLLALTFLAVSVQKRSQWDPIQRTNMYRIVELVGRWSMLDIFVVSVLVALVQLQSLATIRAGHGAVAFGAVVVLTMFAAMEFDPRLIWDPQDDAS